MKNISFFLVFLLVAFLSIATLAQPWYLYRVTDLPNSVNPQVFFSAVDDNVCWGINSNNSQYLRKTDGGTNWTVSTVAGATGLTGSCISAIDVNTAFAALDDPSNATSGGVFKTTDGGQTWAKQTAIFQGAGGHPKDVHFFDSNHGVVIGNPHNGNWEIYTTANGGTQWIQVPFANIPPPAPNTFTGGSLYASAGNYIWFGTYGGAANAFAMYRSTDRGLTWSKFDVPENVTYSVAFKDSMNGLAVDCFYFNGVNKIVGTTDGGVTWSTQNITIPTTPSTYFISYAKGTPGSYVITSNENIGRPQPTLPGSSYTTDDGSTWHLVDNRPHNKAAFSSGYNGWSGGINDSLYNWFSNLLTTPVELISFNSSIYGNSIQLTWQTATEINNKGFEIYRNGNKIAFVEGKGTTSEKQDYAFVDKNLQSGIYNYRLNQLDFDGTQEVVAELTAYFAIPEEFSLEQNYPNPFNPSTTIRFQVPNSSFVNLKVYDILGNEVATLVNEEKTAGSYELNFNASQLSSGIYFYKIEAGSFVETKKMILMK